MRRSLLFIFLAICPWILSHCSLYQSEGRKAIEDRSISITFKSKLQAEAKVFCQDPPHVESAQLEGLQKGVVRSTDDTSTLQTAHGFDAQTGLWWVLVRSESQGQGQGQQPCRYAFAEAAEIAPELPHLISRSQIYLDLLALDQSP